jgi:hypothetical protein
MSLGFELFPVVVSGQELRAHYMKKEVVILLYLGSYYSMVHEDPYMRHCTHSLHMIEVWFRLVKSKRQFTRRTN